MNLDLDAIRANAAEDDDDDIVDYDLIIQLAEKWVEDHPSEKPPRNDIADKMEELVAASDGAGLVRDAVIDALVARWSSLKVSSLQTEWRDSIEAHKGDNQAEDDSDIDERFLATASINFDEPASEPVNGPKLFADIVDALTNNSLVYFSQPEQAEAVALWIMASRFMDSWSHFPHLTVTAPTPESGKSALVTMVSALTPIAKQFGRVTPASIRNIYAEVPSEDADGRPQHLTITVDEMDSVSDGEAAALVTDMKLAFDRVNATTTKNVADDTSPTGMRVVTIPIWGPKLMAGIGLDWIDAPLKSRAVVIHMRPKPADMVIPEIPHDIAKKFADVRSRLVRFGIDNALTVPNADIPDWLAAKGRQRNAWGPMVRVASVLGSNHPDQARRAFDALTTSHALDASIIGIAEQALRDAHTVMQEPLTKARGRRAASARGTDGNSIGMTPSSLAKAMADMDDRPWSEISGGRELSTKKLADLLAAFNVGARGTKTDDGKVVRLYRLADIEAAATPILARWNTNDGAVE